MNRIEAITIENIRGIASLGFTPGSITHIRGRNGTGKSSIISAIRAVFDGGHDPSLVRNGAKKGKVEIALSDGVHITKTITPTRSTLEALDPAGNPIPAAQTFVNRIASAAAVDPQKILSKDTTTAKGMREFCQMLQEAMAVQFTSDSVRAALNGCPVDVPNGALNLGALDKIKTTITERRRRANVEAEQAFTTMDRLRAALPKVVDEADYAEQLNGIKRKLASLSDERKSLECEELRKYNKALAAIEEKYKPLFREIESEEAVIHERRDASLKAAESRRLIDEFGDKCDEANVRAKQADAALKGVEALKAERLKSLPINGLNIEDDVAYLDGVPWSAVNTAQRTSVAVQLAALLSGDDLAFMILDDAEHFDEAARRELEEAAAAAGFQIIAASVDECPLKVEAAAE